MIYHVTVIRECEFTLSVEAPSRADVIRMVTTKALDYDDRDLKSTKIVSIKEYHETQSICNLST